MSQEIKHYVATADYVDFLINKNNQYEDIIKNLPAEEYLDAMQKAQIKVLRHQLGSLKLEYNRSQYSVLKGFDSMEIPDSTAHSFYAYRLDKHKASLTLQ
jgi:hypothetical protein